MAAWSGERGFTLTELVIILVMIGALAVFAVPRLNIGGFDDYAFRQEVVNALRYAQKTAVASRCQVEVDVQSDRITLSYQTGGTATACGTGGFDETLRHPAGSGAFVVEAERNAAITGGLGGVVFDGRGSADTGVTITFADGRTVRVIEDTGFIDG